MQDTPKPVQPSLVLSEPLPLTLHPATVYLSLLAPGSRRTMRQSLDAIASLLTDGQGDAMTLNWAALRYQHTAAVQGTLMAKHSPTTVMKMMCALRRVLKEAVRLDLMDPRDYAKAIDFRGRQAPSKPKMTRVLTNKPPRQILSLLTMKWMGVVRKDEGVLNVW